MIISKSDLNKIISDYLSEGLTDEIGPGWLPYTSPARGNLFRSWVNDNKSASEIAELYPNDEKPFLEREGSANNSYIRKAWRAFGDEFIESMTAPEEEPGLRDRIRDRLQRDGERSSADEDESESGRRRSRQRSGKVKTPCILFTGEFSPASDGAVRRTMKVVDKRAKSLTPKKKKKLEKILLAIFRKLPEGHGGAIIIEPPSAGSTTSKAWSYEFGRYGIENAPAEFKDKMADGIWKTITFDDELDQVDADSIRGVGGIAVPGKTVVKDLGSCSLIEKRNGDYTMSQDEAKRLVEIALDKGDYLSTTRNPLIIDGCVYDRAKEFGGPPGDWRPYFLTPGSITKIFVNLFGGDLTDFDNCGTYSLKVALTGVYGDRSRIATIFMPIIAAPETVIRFARALFPGSKGVDKREIGDYVRDRDSDYRPGSRRKKK